MHIKPRFYFLQNKNKRNNNMHKIESCRSFVTITGQK